MEPPLVMLVVKSTVVPAQMVVPAEELTEMVGVTNGVMLMVMVLLVAVVVERQGAFEVNTHVIWSPLFSVLAV